MLIFLKDEFDDQDSDFLQNHKTFIDKHQKTPYRITPKITVDKEIIHLEKEPSVQVIIPNNGNTSKLINCLRSISENCHYKNYKITIGDYGSSGQEIEGINSYIKDHKNIEFITTKRDSKPEVYNKLGAEVDSELLFFLSSDMVLLNDVISLTVDTYNKNKNNCATVGVRTHQKNHMVRQFGLELFSYQSDEGFELGIDLKGHGKSYAYNNSVIDSVMGNSMECMLVERQFFLKLGGFNLNYDYSLHDFEFSLEGILGGRKKFP